MGLALTLEGNETFGGPHLPNVDALIRAYCRDNVSFIFIWYLRRKEGGGRVASSLKEQWFCDTVYAQSVLAHSPRLSSAPIIVALFRVDGRPQ